MKAVGYWFKEGATALGDRFGAGTVALRKPFRRVGETGAAVAARVRDLDPLRRRSLGGAVGVLAVALIWLLVPIPGVPCGWTPAKECPPPDEAAELVPANSLVFGRLSLEREATQNERADAVAKRLPDLRAIFDGAGTAIGATGPIASFGEEVVPWAEGELAFALVPGAGQAPERVAIVGVGEEKGADSFLDRFGGGAKPATDESDGVEISRYDGGLATARIGDRLVFGSAAGVGAVVRTSAGDAESLAESDPSPRADLPTQRFADVYVSGEGARRQLEGSPAGSGASQLDTFVDYSTTTGFAASFAATTKGIEIEVISDLDPAADQSRRTALATLPEFDPTLLRLAPADTLAYLGAGDFEAAVTDRRRGGLGGAFGGALQALEGDLRGRGGGEALDRLLPLLKGEAALIVEPTGSLPAFTLVVDGVKPSRVERAMADLQAPLGRAYGAADERRVARFEAFSIEGADGYSLDAAPGLQISYAVVDGRLLFSTSRRSLERVAKASGGLTESEPYSRASPQVEEGASAILFVNLDEILGLVELAGLAEDPLYASISDDIGRSGALALSITGERTRLVSRIFLAAPR